MSTNSNQADDLMEDGHSKQTKLQRFLRTLDDQVIKQIRRYLSQNQNPSNQNNSKSDKIRLYQDLMIIQRFKSNQKQIVNNKKKDQLYRQLKNQMNFSVSTIKQRIQKKLSNVSKQQILNHIKLGMNFTFNTKRKLMPLKPLKVNKSQQDDKDIGFEETIKVKRTQQKPISVHSGGQDSPDSVQQIPRVKAKRLQKRQAPPAAQAIQQQSQKDDKIYAGHTLTNMIMNKQKQLKATANKKNKQKNRQQNKNTNQCNLYNQFRNGSDHESDQQFLFIKINKAQISIDDKLINKDGYKLSTVQGQKNYSLIFQIIQQKYKRIKEEQQKKSQLFYQQQNQAQNSQKINVNQNQKIINQQINNLNEVGSIKENENKSTKGVVNSNVQDQNEKQNNNKDQIYQNQQSSERQFAILQNFPNDQQLRRYCSVEDWKLANQNNEYQSLRWHQDEDQFLIQINNLYNSTAPNSSCKPASKLNVLKKFKTSPNIVARLKFLKLSVSNSLMVDLLGTPL